MSSGWMFFWLPPRTGEPLRLRAQIRRHADGVMDDHDTRPGPRARGCRQVAAQPPRGWDLNLAHGRPPGPPPGGTLNPPAGSPARPRQGSCVNQVSPGPSAQPPAGIGPGPHPHRYAHMPPTVRGVQPTILPVGVFRIERVACPHTYALTGMFTCGLETERAPLGERPSVVMYDQRQAVSVSVHVPGRTIALDRGAGEVMPAKPRRGDGRGVSGPQVRQGACGVPG